MKKAFGVIVIILIFVSCSLQKRKAQAIEPIKDSVNISAIDIVTRAIKAEQKIETMNMSKFDMRMQLGEARYVLHGAMTMQKDSLVSIKLQPMIGIEVFRLEFFKDRFVVYDKMNHTYSESPYEILLYELGIDINFQTVQSIVTHTWNMTDVEKQDSTFIAQKYHYETQTDSTYVLFGNVNVNNYVTYAEVTKNNFEIKTIGYAKKTNLIHHVDYSDNKMVKKILFPHNIKIDLDHNKFYFTANITVEKVIFNEEITKSTINTEKYKRVPLNSYFEL